MLKALRKSVQQKILHSTINSMDKAGFGPALMQHPLTSLDIGARGGAQNDLMCMARHVDMVGFEPDPEEFTRLQNSAAHGPWKSYTPLPYALGSRAGEHALQLYSKNGCHSLLTARPGIAALFSRGDYFNPQGQINITVESLDHLIEAGKVRAADHIKIDVQGWELEVFKGAERTLRRDVLALRTEVSFFDLYEGQPFFSDIDAYLRGCGFVLMGFVEAHGWRRRTKTKWPRRAAGPIPYSRGQLMHADALYMKTPEHLADQPAQRLKLGLLAAAYEYCDHAAACFTGMDPVLMQALGRWSQALKVRRFFPRTAFL